MCALEPSVALASKMPAIARLARSTTFEGVGTVQHSVAVAVRLLTISSCEMLLCMLSFDRGNGILLLQVSARDHEDVRTRDISVPGNTQEHARASPVRRLFSCTPLNCTHLSTGE